MTQFRYNYNKALKVINSCNTLYQALTAERYIENFVNLYTVSKKNGLVEFESDFFVKPINYLIKKIEEKKSKFI